jgi:hypothetical protein
MSRIRWSAVVGAVVVVIGTLALMFGAARGNATVTSLNSPSQAADLRLENAYYRCISIQTRSLVSPSEPVSLNVWYEVLDVLRGAGVWLTAAPPTDALAPQLTLASRPGPLSCHGMVVEARFRLSDGKTVIRIGTGASVPGNGPLPRPEL